MAPKAKRGAKRAAPDADAEAAENAKVVAEAAVLAQKKILQNFKDFTPTEIDIMKCPVSSRTLREQLQYDILQKGKGDLRANCT